MVLGKGVLSPDEEAIVEEEEEKRRKTQRQIDIETAFANRMAGQIAPQFVYEDIEGYLAEQAGIVESLQKEVEVAGSEPDRIERNRTLNFAIDRYNELVGQYGEQSQFLQQQQATREAGLEEYNQRWRQRLKEALPEPLPYLPGGFGRFLDYTGVDITQPGFQLTYPGQEAGGMVTAPIPPSLQKAQQFADVLLNIEDIESSLEVARDMGEIKAASLQLSLANQDFEVLYKNLIKDGRTPQAVNVLTAFGATPEEIDSIFGTLPDARASLLRKEGYQQKRDLLISRGTSPEEADKILRKQLPSQIIPSEEGFWKDVGQVLYVGFRSAQFKTGQFFVTVVPGLLYPEDYNQDIRNQFRKIAANAQSEWDYWVDKHPEFETPEQFRGDPFENPELLKSPKYLVYTFAESLPFTLAILGTITTTTLLTGGNLPAGLVAGFAIDVPLQTSDAYEELLFYGADEVTAARLALAAGILMSALDTVGNLPLLNAISKPSRPLTDNIRKSVLKKIVENVVKRGGKVVGQELLSETVTEDMQTIIQNTVVKTYDKERGLFEGIGETTIKTLIATSPFALFGGAVSMRGVSFERASQVSNAEKQSQGWKLDATSGIWFEPKPLTEVFVEAKQEFVDVGLTDEQATVKALNEVAKTAEGSQIISDAVDKIESAKPVSPLEATIPAQAAPPPAKGAVVTPPVTPEVAKYHPEKIQQQIDDLRKQLKTVPRGQPAKEILNQINKLEGQLAQIKRNELLAGKTEADFEIKQIRPSPLGGKLWSVIDKTTNEEISAASTRKLAQESLTKILKRVKGLEQQPAAPVTPEVAKKKAIRLTPEAEVQMSYQILKDKLTSEGIDPNVIDIALETYGFKPKIDRLGAVLTRENLFFKLQDAVGVEDTIRKLTREILGKKFGVPANEVDRILEGGSRVRPDVDIAEAKSLGEKIADLIRRGLPTRKVLLSRYLPPTIPKAKAAPEVTALARRPIAGIGREPPVRPMSETEKFLRQEAEVARFVRELPIGRTFKYFDESTFKIQEGKILGVTESKEGETLIRIKPLVGKEFTVSPEYLAETYGLSIEEQVAKLIERTRQSIKVARGEGIYKDYADKTLQTKYEAELTKLQAIPEAEAGVARPVQAVRQVPGEPEAPVVTEAVVITETTPTGEEIPSAIKEAPAPTEGATARVFKRIQTEYAETGFREKFSQGWHHFNIKMVDDLDPIRRIVDQLKKGDVQLSIDENPYLLARLLRGVTSKATTFLEYGTFGKDFWKVENGKAIPNYIGESLQNILNEVKDPVKWRDFSTYLTARRAVELSARDIETGIEVADARASIAELEAKYSEFEGLSQRVYKYQDSLLVYAQEMGLISRDLLGNLRKHGNYVPFYRVFNELQAKGLFGKKMANIASPIKRIKGSEREIINPLESIVKNTYVLVNAADRNQVGIAIANLVDKNPELADVFERVKTPIARVARVSAKELGIEVEGLTEGEEEQMVDIFRPSFFVRGDEVTVLIDGKKNYYRVDADLRDSLLRLDRESLGLLGKWLGAPARWLRAGATLSPDFMFRNPARDQLTAFAYSNYGFMPGIDWIKGMASMLRKDADYQLFRMSGAEHSMLVSMDRSYLQKTFKQIVEGKGFTEYVKHPLELFRIISELGEKATRLGEFKKGIQRGAVPLEAGYSARSVSLDFAQAGTAAQAINTFIAFFNANIRGWGRMASSFKEHPLRTSSKVFLGITLPSILLWTVNHDDERWKEIPQWQKDLFWIVFVGDNIYRIPKPFELGIIFGSVPERFLDWLVEKDPDLLKNLAQTLMEAGSPGFIPTAGLPILEWITNYSFFRGRAIVPENRQAMPPELQYTPWTSEVSKKLGELLKLPPAQIDNLMFAWTGGLGRYATDILDGILKGTGISPDIPQPSPTLADMPVIKAFVVRSPYGSSSEAVNDFYDYLEKYESGEKYLKQMLTNGELEKYNEYKAAHPELFFFADFDSERYAKAIAKGETPKDVFYSSSARYLRRVASQLSEIRKKEDLIYKDAGMSPEKKRELIDELEILKTDIARKAVDLLQQKEPPILQGRINEVVGKLGEVIEEATPLSLEKADIFTVPDAYRQFDSILEGATIEDLKGLEGINPLALAYIKKEELEKTLEPILNKQVKDIDFNLKEGVPFEDYYKQWQLGLAKDSPLDKISRRQVELLRRYEASDDKKAFLKGLTDEDIALLEENPQKEWLKSHPTENAEWALAGKTPLLTKEAYTEFIRLAKELDIPDGALPELTLPPEGSIDAYFERQDVVNEWGANSWEDKLLRAKNPELNEWLGLGEIDTPLASLELKIKNRELSEQYDALTTDKERQQFKIDNSDWLDDMRRIDAIEKGTEDNPTPENIISGYLEYMKKQDEKGMGANSAEVMLMRVDDPDLDEWLVKNKELQPVDQSHIPTWRIDVKYRKEDAEYDALPTTGTARQDYLAANDDYRMDRRRREAYGDDFPTEQVENFVAYHDLPERGHWRNRFLLETEGFGDAMHKIKGIDLPKPEDVFPLEYDQLRDDYGLWFDRHEGYSDFESEYYIEDEDKRKAEREDLFYDTAGEVNDFATAFYKRQGYELKVPEAHLDTWAEWKILSSLKGKPDDWKDVMGTEDYFEDDFFLKEHIDFYRELRDAGLIPKVDFTNVPETREIFDQYLVYQAWGNKNSPSYIADNSHRSKVREYYRWLYRDFGQWLVDAKDYTPIAKKHPGYIVWYDEKGNFMRLEDIRGLERKAKAQAKADAAAIRKEEAAKRKEEKLRLQAESAQSKVKVATFQ